LRPDEAAGLVESAHRARARRLGLSVTSDQKQAWSRAPGLPKVSLVELSTMKLRATAADAREPRGIALLPDGKTRTCRI